MGTMNCLPHSENQRCGSAVVWVLRITVALQCLGNWGWFTRYVETPLLHWMLGPADIGGLGWSEASALATQQGLGWLALAAGVLVLVRPWAAVLGLLVLLQILIATAMWRIDDGFSLQVDWLEPQVTALFPFATQSARIAAPLGLLLLVSKTHVSSAIAILRWAAAITFIAHGTEAALKHPFFVDLLISTSQNYLGLRMSEPTAEWLLELIALADFVVAVAVVTTRWRWAGWWMVFWGGLTASSRVLVFGLSAGWFQTLTRTPHLGVPLAVVLAWHAIRCSDKPSTAAEALVEGSSNSSEE